MEQDADAAPNIVPYSYEQHLAEYNRGDIVYLSIYDNHQLAGFFILALDPDNHSVEFRRIVVACKDRGIGQQAISQMETYCREQLNRNRVWLDVFDFNQRGQHVYAKLGYKFFDQKDFHGQTLLCYQKSIA
jgi:RimJ/RimL family protein N-acetyltransferase